MSILSVFLSAIFFTILGMGYVKGYNIVKEKDVTQLVKYYLLFTAIRFVLVMTVVGTYVVFEDNREDSLRFAAMFFGMYVVMLIITLIIKH